MSIRNGDIGRPPISPTKTFTITPGTSRETLLATPSVLPTVEPAVAQVSFTVQASDLPTISPSAPLKYNAAIYASGKVGAAASVITYRVYKNGVSVIQASGASAAATQVWNHTHWRTFDVVPGDVLEVRYWAAQADVNIDWFGLIVYPVQPNPAKLGVILKDLTFANIITGPTFTAITPTVQNSLNFYLQPTSIAAHNIAMTAVTKWDAVVPTAPFGLFRGHIGDIFGAATTQYVHATQRQIQKTNFPGTISFREVLR